MSQRPIFATCAHASQNTFRPTVDCRVSVRDATEAQAVCRQRILPTRHSLRHPAQYAQHGHRVPQPGELLSIPREETDDI